MLLYSGGVAFAQNQTVTTTMHLNAPQTTITESSEGIVATPAPDEASTTVVTHSTPETTITRTADGGTSSTTTTHYYYFNDRDANDKGILTAKEFPTYVYDRWDRNHDGIISDDEWKLSAVRWYTPAHDVTYKTFSAWDTNHDGHIDQSEMAAAINATKIYGNWDKNGDGIIDPQEYAEATFHIYDANGDGVISKQEWVAAQ